MTRATRQQGFTLVELLVTMTISTVVFGATLSALTVMLRQGQESDRQSEAQSTARIAIDRLTLSIRNSLAAPNAAPSTVERILPYDLVIQTVDPLSTAPAGNAMNVMRVRYCLDDAADQSKGTLRMQTQRWTAAATPALPAATTCTAAAAGWDDNRILASDLVNRRDGQNRELFRCWLPDAATPGACPPASTSIRSIRTAIVVDTDPVNTRGERELSGTAFLRNANRPPLAAFAVTQANGFVTLNASASSDPDGESLTYAWYRDGTLVAGETRQRLSLSGLTPGSQPVFRLEVTDRGGLKGRAERTVTVQ